MVAECIRVGWLEYLVGLRDLGETLGGLFFTSLILVVILAPVVLLLYQRKIEKLMSTSSPANATIDVFTHSQASSPRLEPTPKPAINLSAEEVLQAGKTRARELQQTLILVVSVFSILVLMTVLISNHQQGNVSHQSLGDLLVWIGEQLLDQLWIIGVSVPVFFLGMRKPQFTRVFWTVCAPIVLIWTVVYFGFDDEATPNEMIEGFIGTIILALLLFWGVGGRRMRNVVPLLTLIGCLLWIEYIALAVLLTIFNSCLGDDSGPIGALIGLVLLVAYVWTPIWLTFRMLDGLSRAYERKVFSDAQFQLGAWMLVFTILGAGEAGNLADDTDQLFTVWSLGVVVALVISLGLYLQRLRHIAPLKYPQQLLLLRVFANDTRGERLLDEVAYHWRFIGPIYMVGGPDLAKINLEPHELLQFLRRKTSEVFLRDKYALEHQLANTDDSPDPDARYRINEFFCFDDVWPDAVKSLIDRCPVALLDLREFDESRKGTTLEVSLLAKKGALNKTILLTDETTDMVAVEKAVIEVPGASIPSENILKADRSLASIDISRALHRVATPSESLSHV